MGFKEGIRACAKRSTHHFIGLGFWQAWQMVMLCTNAIIPDGGEGARLKSIALFATTAGYLVVIAAYKIKPGLSSSPKALLSAGVTMAAGTFLMLFVAFVSDAGLKFVALASALALMSWGNAALLIMWGELWETLATGRVGQHLYLSYAFAFVLFFIAIALPHPIDGLFACLFPLASCFILKSCGSEPRRHPTSAPHRLEDVPFKQFIAFIVLLSTLWGVSQKIAPKFITPASPTFFLAESMFVAGVAIAALAANLALTSPESESISLYEPIAPAMALGIVALAILPEQWAPIGNGILTMGVYCLDMFLMLTATDLAFRTGISAALLFGGTVVASRIGTTVGTFFASFVLGNELDDVAKLTLAVISLGVIVAAATLLFSKADLMKIYEARDARNVSAAGGNSTSPTPGGVKAPASANVGQNESTSGATALAMPLTIEAQCAIVVDRAGLTAREAEVLELLVRGRTVQDICDELTIAKGTAKHHVSNIYRKLGVGDRRSLYDVVESARE